MMKVLIAHHDPPNMTPKECDEWTMRIFSLIAVGVVHPVSRSPARWGILKATEGTKHQGVLKPPRRVEAAVCQQAVIAHGDRLPKHVNASKAQDHPCPREERWHED
jgi:hypothetical protein